MKRALMSIIRLVLLAAGLILLISEPASYNGGWFADLLIYKVIGFMFMGLLAVTYMPSPKKK